MSLGRFVLARKPESVFKNSVHRYLAPGAHRQSMASIFSNGTPDEYYEGPGNILWIEYKYIEQLPPTIDLCNPKGRPKLSALQQEWLMRAHGNSIPICVILGCKEGGVMYQYGSWTHPEKREDIKYRMLSRKELAQWISKQIGILM